MRKDEEDAGAAGVGSQFLRSDKSQLRRMCWFIVLFRGGLPAVAFSFFLTCLVALSAFSFPSVSVFGMAVSVSAYRINKKELELSVSQSVSGR